MFRLLVDHDFNERILQGVQSRAEINAVLSRTVGLEGKPDAALLGWAADENRIVLSHDLQTMPGFEGIHCHDCKQAIEIIQNAYERQRPGLFE